MRDDALAVLRRLTNNSNADFHPGQFEAIAAVVDQGRRALVVQRTGWGKSAVYFVATALLRQGGAGPTLLVSPLLALMRDQIGAAERAGVKARAINSANATEWSEINAELSAGEIDVLMVSPERLTNPKFRDEQLPWLLPQIGLLVIDEAHCISDWGHDFRPDYRRIREVLARLGDTVPVLGTTATANSRVVDDVHDQLGSGGHDVVTIRGPLGRNSLRLGVLRLGNDQERLAWLLTNLAGFTGSGIIYTLTVAAADDIAAALRAAGHNVASYTGGTDPAERELLEQQLRDNELKALVATSALGMGFDKPDLGFVMHVGVPSSPVSYYQHIGRAGRGVDQADVLALPGVSDRDIWHYFATASMPAPDEAQAVLETLASSEKALSTAALETIVNVRRNRLELLLKVLAVDGAVQRVSGGWLATGQPWQYDAQRYERVAAARTREQELMTEYVHTSTCRMEFIQQCLDDDTAAACGRCDNCAGPWYPTVVSDEARRDAQTELERAGVGVDPRAQWPTGVKRLGIDLSGKIPVERRVEPGRVVARFTDVGWGQAVRVVCDGEDGVVPDSLGPAVVRTLAQWDWGERPVGVVSVPSRRRPQLVRSLAQRISQVGKLPVLGELSLVGGGPEGDRGGNSAFRLAAVWRGIGLDSALADAVRSAGGPILLVDDVVDSRWTMTVGGYLLREAGAPAVLPFALASVM